jgi:His-Xaa-Ser system radical SAM maturase HxsC
MLKLSGKIVAYDNFRDTRKAGEILQIWDSHADDFTLRKNKAFLVKSQSPIPLGYSAYLLLSGQNDLKQFLPLGAPTIILEDEFSYLRHGDVIRASVEDMRVRTLYRKESSQNHFLVTERCDNYCLMCSQPPKNQNDDWVIEEILETLPLIDKSTKELGFTGGEPTLLGDRFLDVLRQCKSVLPETGIHVLSNGRSFSNYDFAKAWAAVEHPDLMVGIPIYADVSTVHDYVVQADGAFDETIRGILNLKRFGQRVEIRVVLHQQTIPHLPRLAHFIARNLLFVDHVALMGLEIMGFTRANLDSLWIEPSDYQTQLRQAVETLDSSGIRVSIYNLPLCLLDKSIWPFAMQSISDWKNEFLPQCNECDVRPQCAGFFWSSKFKQSSYIRPVKQVSSMQQFANK